MGGTRDGARKRTERLLAQDPNYFSRIGAKGKKGGKLSSGSFTTETARAAGAKGGRVSKRGKAKKNVEASS